MSAPVGNRFWEARSSHGRKPIFEAPDALWEASSEYFEWTEVNPLYEDKIVTYEGVATHEPMAKMRAMTISGLCLFLDISRRTWDDYKVRKDFIPVCERVEQVIRDQKFGGAAANLLNANIIARDLGLADRSEHTGPGGGPMVTTSIVTEDPAEAAKIYQRILSGEGA